MRRSKRFRKKQTKRKTKKIIVGGVKFNTSKKPSTVKFIVHDHARIPNLTQLTREALAAANRAAEDEAQRMAALAIQAKAHAESTQVVAQAAYSDAVKASTYAARVEAAAAKSEAWLQHQVSAELFQELSEGNKAATTTAALAANSALNLAEQRADTWDAATRWADYRVRKASKAKDDHNKATAREQRFASLHSPPYGNAFTDLIENTSSILAAAKSSAAPPAADVPLPSSKLLRR